MTNWVVRSRNANYVLLLPAFLVVFLFKFGNALLLFLDHCWSACNGDSQRWILHINILR